MVFKLNDVNCNPGKLKVFENLFVGFFSKQFLFP